jgi:hypothetical protein
MFDTTNFQLSYSKKDIPRAFKRHFKSAYHQAFTIANPEEDFYKVHNVNRNLPHAHLIFTSKETKNGIGFLYYEVVVGGMELRSYLFISVYSEKKITKELMLQIPNEIRDYSTLKQSVKEHHFIVVAET